MNMFKTAAVSTLLATVASTSAFAAAHTDPAAVTCADFAAMNSEDMMATAMAAEEGMMADTMAMDADEDDSTDMAEGADTEMATDTEAAEGTEIAEGTDTDAMATDDMDMSAVMAACDGNDDMMVMDAMSAM